MWGSWPPVSLKEVIDESNKTKYFLFLNTHDKANEHLTFSLLNGVTSYHVEVTPKDIKDMAQKCRMPLEKFTNLAVAALTCGSATEGDFVYSISETLDSLQLTWKKVVEEEAVKIKLGSLTFRTVNNANEVCNIMQQLSKYLLEKSKETEVLNQEKASLQSANGNLRDILESKIVSKDQLEKELYTKFVLVLNAKKQKCKEYKEKLSKSGISEHSDNASGVESDHTQTGPTQERKNTGLLFEDSSDDSAPALTQRVVKKKNLKRENPQKVQRKVTRKSVRNSSPEPECYQADTQDLMDDL